MSLVTVKAIETLKKKKNFLNMPTQPVAGGHFISLNT